MPRQRLQNRRVVRVVRIAERLTYGEVDADIKCDSDMARLYRFAAALRVRRINAGAISFQLPELQLHVGRSHDISLKLRDRETPGQVLVSEFMILAKIRDGLE